MRGLGKGRKIDGKEEGRRGNRGEEEEEVDWERRMGRIGEEKEYSIR